MRARPPLSVLLLVAVVGLSLGAALLARSQTAQSDFINFESSHVHPLALDAKGAVSTPSTRRKHARDLRVCGNGALRSKTCRSGSASIACVPVARGLV
jgi:hypothetical protein